MKVWKLTGLNTMELMEVPTPEVVADKDVLIRMKSLGICGSDVHYYKTGRIGSQVVTFPFAVGHEGAGEVVAVGSGVTRVGPGSRVAIEPAVSCGVCDQCRANRAHTCRKLKFLGCPGQLEGCLAEYIVMPESCCYPIPDTMSLEEAALSEPLSIGIYAVQQSIPMAGARIAILGAGPIGLSVLLAARSQGAELICVTDKIQDRLMLAGKCGADWVGNPESVDVVEAMVLLEPLLFDAVFECCGEQEAIDQAQMLLKPGGKLMLVGIPPTAEHVYFSPDLCRRKELCIQNVRRQNHCVQKALDAIADGSIDVNQMVTHRFDFADAPAGFELVAAYADGVCKALVEWRA